MNQRVSRHDPEPPEFTVKRQHHTGRSAHLSGKVKDCLFLSIVVLLSVSLYAQSLGFYSDDWFFLVAVRSSADQSFAGRFLTLYRPHDRMRPIQILYFTGLYSLFGLHPFGYHLVNTAVFLFGVVLLYLALCELGRPRVLAIAVSAIYALLPHYSSGRFWPIAFHTSLSMALFFSSLYSDLRALRAQGGRLWGWKLLAILSLIASTLTYEVFLPLFLLNLVLVWRRGRQLYGSASGKWPVRANLALLFGSNLLVMISVIVFKVLTTTRMTLVSPVERLAWFTGFVKEAAKSMIGGDYGLRLPRVVWRILRDYPDGLNFAVAGAIGLVVFGYLYRRSVQYRDELLSRSNMLKLMVGGAIVFGLGYVVFLDYPIRFTTTGIENRTAIAAAVGVALLLVGGLGWISALLPPGGLRRGFFSVLVALYCASSFVIVTTLAQFWTGAYQRQHVILADIRQQIPTLPAESSLILDGVCPYHGPAPVFDAPWDLAGALQMLYHDPTLQAHVVTPAMEVREDGLHMLYNEDQVYPYEKLFVYDFGRKMTHRLADAEAARLYFETFNPDYSSGCPWSLPGLGERVF